jgi:endonuclease/exonuclease/phosphatase family metal-dependent hydrolase
MKLPDKEYRECLDIIQTIIEKYGLTQEMVLCGDMNGTLIDDRNNAHDCKLKNFVKENKLLHSDALSTQPTFFHHNGKSTSQIDYILLSGNFINKTNILRPELAHTFRL